MEIIEWLFNLFGFEIVQVEPVRPTCPMCREVPVTKGCQINVKTADGVQVYPLCQECANVLDAAAIGPRDAFELKKLKAEHDDGMQDFNA